MIPSLIMGVGDRKTPGLFNFKGLKRLTIASLMGELRYPETNLLNVFQQSDKLRSRTSSS
jgi:hypothetical protein